MATAQIYYDGQSLTVGSGSTGGQTYPVQTQALLSGSWFANNSAVSGQTTAGMITRGPSVIDANWQPSKTPHIVAAWEVTNDLFLGATQADAYARMVSYCQARRAARYRVVLLTVLPRTEVGNPATFETDRLAINALFRANWRSYADGLADVAADPTIGFNGAQANTTYYVDGVHLTNAGYGIVAGIVAPVIASVVLGEPMAAGPFFPNSTYPVTAGRVFPGFHVGAGANSKQDQGLQVEASLGADAIWRLRWAMPPSLPTGTLKLVVLALANATSGVARINPKWVSVAAGVSPSGATLVAETVTPDSVTGAAGAGDTITWGAGDNDQYILAKWTLNATTAPAANEVVVMDLTFETASWTLAQVLTAIPYLVWE